MDYNAEKFDIVIVGGQSNAEGYGIGDVSQEYEKNELIHFLTDDGIEGYILDANGDNALKCKSNPHIITGVAEEPVVNGIQTGQLALFFAKRYIQSGLLSKDRKLLLVNTAVGGTGFSRKEWGVGCILQKRLISLTKEALNRNSQNKIIAFLWHQGEHDAYENKEYNGAKRYRNHYYNLRSFIESVYEEFGRIPLIAGGFCDEWYLKNKIPCDAVLNAISDVVEDLGGAFVKAHGLKSNNEVVANGDDIHFSRESLHLLGSAYFEAFTRITQTK